MRIALVAEDFYPQTGGIPEHVNNLARELLSAGHQPEVITSRMHGDEMVQVGYPVQRVGKSVVIFANGGVSRVTVGWRVGRRLEEVFRDGRYDVVHVHGALAPTLGILAARAARRTGIPLVGTFHSWFPRSAGYRLLQRPLQRLLSAHAAVIAVSPPVAEAHQRYFQAEWEIIPNGVNLDVFTSEGRGTGDEGRVATDSRVPRPPSPVPPSAPRLLYLHRLEPRNNLGTLLAAMPRILVSYPNVTLTVAGDGPWRHHYERRAARLGPSVRFVGRVQHPPELYRSADLYLCPTMRAGFGITLLEAMACGTPIVVADNPGFRYVLDGGRAGIRLPYDRPVVWADAIVKLLDDPARREAMGKAGVEKARDYAWPLVARQIIGVYERVAS